MKIMNVTQGSAEWLALRARHLTASEAPVMMGASSKVRRSELLHIKATGDDREVSDWVQTHLFDTGHAYEAAARPLVEQLIGEELYPATAVDDDGYLLASFDGLTLLGDTVYEHKMWNAELAAAVRQRELPAEYYWQLEQQLYVSGAARVIFACSDGTEENFVWMEYRPVPGRREQLLAGWTQFEQDLAAYAPEPAAPEAVGRAPEQLPALRIEVRGMVTASNLAEFREHALAIFAGIKTDLSTDNDFADAEKTVKWCKEVEERLDAAKQHALSQTASIDELFRTIDVIKDEARTKRLELDRLVKARKDAIREEIRQGAVIALREHYNTLNATFANRVVLGMPASFGADVGGAMKGKKTLASLRDAADTALAAAKIEANQCADRVRFNLQLIDSYPEHAHLLPDAAQLATSKTLDDLKAIITARISEHQAAEERRLAAERERIRQEEQRKLEAEQKEKQAAEAAAAVAEGALEAQVDEIKTELAPAPRAAGKQAPRSFHMALSDWQQAHEISDVAVAELLALLSEHGALQQKAA